MEVYKLSTSLKGLQWGHILVDMAHSDDLSRDQNARPSLKVRLLISRKRIVLHVTDHMINCTCFEPNYVIFSSKYVAQLDTYTVSSNKETDVARLIFLSLFISLTYNRCYT